MISRRPLAVVFCALLTAYSVQWMYLVRHLPPVGIGFDGTYRPIAGEYEIQSLPPKGPGELAGLKVGDRIAAINSQSLRTVEPLLNLRAGARADVPVHLTVRRGGQTLDLVVTPALRPTVPPGLSGTLARLHIAQFLFSLLAFYPLPFLAVAVSVLLQRPQDTRAWLLALMLGGFIALAPIGDFEFRIPHAWRGVTLAFWALMNVPLPAVAYAFFAIFPAHSALDRRVPWLKWTIGLLAASLAGVSAVALLAAGGSYPVSWMDERTAGGKLTANNVLGVYSLSFFVLAMVSLALNAFGPPDVRRKTRVILFGMLVGLLPIMALQITIGIFGVPIQRLPVMFWVLSILSLFAIPFSLGYAVVKHRAMEIPVLLRRSARYLLVRRGLVTLAILVGVAVTFGFAQVINKITDLPGDELSAGLIAGSLFGGILAIVGQKAWLPAAERLDRAFFRGQYDARRLLQTLADQTRLATDRAALAELIDQSVTEALHPKSLLVFLRGDDESSLTAAAHESLSGDAAHLPASHGQLMELTRRGRPVLIDPAQLGLGGLWQSFAALAPEALVPLVGRSGQMEGLLVLGPRLSEEPYSGEDVGLLGSVGTQAGLALENIRLAETMATRLEAERRARHELEIARDVQSKLLPQDRPPVSTLDYAGACLQARVVGGDFFDFAAVSPSQVALVLADISGKGISAALLMASLQANLRALYTQAPHDLARLLDAVNRTFYDSTAANHYATLFFALYDDDTRVLTYANCGHLPPVLLREDGSVERLGVTAGVIGLFTPWECCTSTVTLAAGDTLVVFTDGASEATSDSGEEFGEDRLLAVIREHRGEPAIQLLETIVEEVRAHGGADQYDDLTLIVARVT
jgi:sigma-B regulation protein RsbU (phosphoserine phosphatase)